LGKVVYGENKVNLIKNFVKQNCYDLKLSYSYSDHYSDINLFKMVEYPVIVNPDNKLKKVALLKGWEIKIFNQ